jgi:hypothetical protein
MDAHSRSRSVNDLLSTKEYSLEKSPNLMRGSLSALNSVHRVGTYYLANKLNVFNQTPAVFIKLISTLYFLFLLGN